VARGQTGKFLSQITIFGNFDGYFGLGSSCQPNIRVNVTTVDHFILKFAGCQQQKPEQSHKRKNREKSARTHKKHPKRTQNAPKMRTLEKNQARKQKQSKI
jgi:hypothetical protein